MRFQRTSLLTLALVALFALVAGPMHVYAQTNDSPEISHLLNEARYYSMQADRDATELESYTRSKVSWHTHAQTLESIKNHVNNMGKLLQQMQDIKSEGSPWQQNAIDQIDPMLRQMADHLTTTIEYGNDHPNLVHMMKFQNYVQAMATFAADTHQLISDVVAYDQARAKAQMLEQKLEIPSSSTPESE